MKDIMFSYEGLRSRIAVTSSCKVFGRKKIDNLKALLKMMKAGTGLRAETIFNNLPEKDIMMKALMGHAMLEGKKVIDENFIWRYFGGKDHIDFVSDQIRIQGLEKNPEFANKFLLTHLILPSTIISAGKYPSAVYTNGKIRIRLGNLVIHPFAGKVSVNDRVLVHQATIVIKNINKRTEKWILKEQRNCQEFINAAKEIKTVDLETFWELKSWTEKLLKKLFPVP